jgi:hypothetical protein
VTAPRALRRDGEAVWRVGEERAHRNMSPHAGEIRSAGNGGDGMDTGSGKATGVDGERRGTRVMVAEEETVTDPARTELSAAGHPLQWT